jgi:hypothetical protein
LEIICSDLNEFLEQYLIYAKEFNFWWTIFLNCVERKKYLNWGTSFLLSKISLTVS